MSSDINSSLCMEGESLVLPESCNVGEESCFNCCKEVCGNDNTTACLEACGATSTSTNGIYVYNNHCSSNYTDSTAQQACCQTNCNNDETCTQNCIDASHNFIGNILTDFPEVGISDYNTCFDCTNSDTLEQLFGGSKANCCKKSSCPSGCATGCMLDGDTCVEDDTQVTEIPEISTNFCENNPNCKDNNKKWLKTFYDNLIQELQTPDDEGLVPNTDMTTCYVNTLAKLYPDPSTIPEQFPDIIQSQLDECIVNPDIDPGTPQLYFEEIAPVVPTEEEPTDSAISLLFNDLVNFVKNNLVIVCLVILAGILLYNKNRNKSKNTNSKNYQTSLSSTVNKLN